MLVLTVEAAAPVSAADEVREQLAMELEPIGRAKIVRVESAGDDRLRLTVRIDRPPGGITPDELETLKALERRQAMKVLSQKQVEPEQLTLFGQAKG